MRLLFAITNPISILLLRGQTKFNKSKGAEVFLATAYDESVEEQISEEGFIYRTDYWIISSSYNSDGRQILAFEFKDERRAMLLKLKGIENE